MPALSLVQREPSDTPVEAALRAVSIAWRTDAARTRRELLKLLAELEDV